MLGRWDEAVARAAELPVEQLGVDTGVLSVLTGVLEIQLRRGELVTAQELLAHFEEFGRSDGRAGGHRAGHVRPSQQRSARSKGG